MGVLIVTDNAPDAEWQAKRAYTKVKQTRISNVDVKASEYRRN